MNRISIDFHPFYILVDETLPSSTRSLTVSEMLTYSKAFIFHSAHKTILLHKQAFDS